MTSVIGTWLAAFFTLAIFSFLYKDNPFYKVAEHLYVGISAAFWLIYVWSFTVYPLLVKPMIKNGLWGENLLLLIPLVFSIMMLFRLIPNYGWISRWPMAFTVGLGAGLGLTGAIQGILFPQMRATVLDLWLKNNPLGTLNNWLLIIGVITTIFYFFFSQEHKGAFGKIARVGIAFIMISFGASFGFTVMARVSILIGRVGFLLGDWLHLIK